MDKSLIRRQREYYDKYLFPSMIRAICSDSVTEYNETVTEYNKLLKKFYSKFGKGSRYIKPMKDGYTSYRLILVRRKR